ncbi:MAG: toxin-antitoxin system YwqK family antitoxin, partial [Candidatus Omnitrophota bacterium]
EIVNGIQVGLSKEFFPTGELSSEQNYVNGKIDGDVRVFHPKGGLAYIDTYAAGVKIKRKGFDDRGKLEFEQNY